MSAVFGSASTISTTDCGLVCVAVAEAGERRIGFARIHGDIIFGVDELHGDGVVAILFGDANDFGLLRGIQRGGGGRIGEDDIETLAFPVTGARNVKK